MKVLARPYCDASVERTGTCTKYATRLARTDNPNKVIYLCDEHCAPQWLMDATEPYTYTPPQIDADDFQQWPDDDWADLR